MAMMLNRARFLALLGAGTLAAALAVCAAEPTKVLSSYGPTNQDVTFSQIKSARLAVKAERAKAHAALLSSRYDLKKAAGEAKMSGGRPVPVGPTARVGVRDVESAEEVDVDVADGQVRPFVVQHQRGAEVNVLPDLLREVDFEVTPRDDVRIAS